VGQDLVGPGGGELAGLLELGLGLGWGGGQELADEPGGFVAAGGAEGGDQDGEAEGAADLLGDVEEAGGGAGLVGWDAGDGDDGEGDEQEAHADGEHEHGGEEAVEVPAGHRDLGEPGEAGEGEQGAGGHQAPGPSLGRDRAANWEERMIPAVTGRNERPARSGL
jgi:hypothetical protein